MKGLSEPLFTPESTDSTTDASIVDDELAMYETPSVIAEPLFTPEDTDSTTDASIVDNELVTYETPPIITEALFTPEDTDSTTDASIVDGELVMYETPPQIPSVIAPEFVVGLTYNMWVFKVSEQKWYKDGISNPLGIPANDIGIQWGFKIWNVRCKEWIER